MPDGTVLSAGSRAFGRSIQDFLPLLPAEQKLRLAVSSGTECVLGDSQPPSDCHSDIKIRGAFVRFLALGGDEDVPVHEFGVWLRGACIDGNIDLDASQNVYSLWLNNCLIAGDLSLYGAKLQAVSLDGCQIGRVLGDQATVEGSFLMRHGFKATGAVLLRGANIAGDFSCDGATLLGSEHNAEFVALDLSAADIRRDLHLRDNFCAHGLVRAVDAKIGGVLDATNGKFFGQEMQRSDGSDHRRALECVRVKVAGSVFLRYGCECHGEASFVGARIGQDLDCRRGLFVADRRDRRAYALRLNRISVAGMAYLSAGFSAKGAVRLNSAKIGSDLICIRGTFDVRNYGERRSEAGDGRKKDGYAIDALSLSAARIGGTLFLASVESYAEDHINLHGSLDFKGTRVNNLCDSAKCWPKPLHVQRRGKVNAPINVIYLDGFVYSRLLGRNLTAAKRKDWLRRQPREHLWHDFRPQPFEQLIRVLRASGHNEEAKRIAVFKQDFLVQNDLLFWWRKPARWVVAPFINFAQILRWILFGVLTGYGYRPVRAFFFLIGLWLAAAWFFDAASKHSTFAPRDPDVYLNDQLEDCRPENGGNWTECGKDGKLRFAEHPSFNPLVYSADLILPVVDLEQETSWQPMKRPFPLEVPHYGVVTVPDWGLQAVMWVVILFGWAVSLLLAAAVSGLVKQD